MATQDFSSFSANLAESVCIAGGGASLVNRFR